MRHFPIHFAVATLFVAAFSASVTEAQKLSDESSVTFRVDPKEIKKRGKVAVNFLSPAQLRKHPLASLGLEDFESLQEHEVILSKAAFVISSDLTNGQTARKLASPKTMECLVDGARVDGDPGRQCKLSMPVPIPAAVRALVDGLPDELRCDLDHQFSTVKVGNQGVDTNLETPTAVSIQRCEEFNLIFKRSYNVTHFYRLSDKETLVVHYGVIAFRDSARRKAERIPFFNFRNKLKSRIKDDAEKLSRGLEKIAR